MIENDLKESILQLIEDLYQKKYIGHIKIKKLKPLGYTVWLGMNNDDKPIIISAELDKVRFLKFFKQELLDRHWDHIKYFIGIKNYPDNERQRNN